MTPRLTYAQRKERIAAKIARFQAGGDAGKYYNPALPSHLPTFPVCECLTMPLTVDEDDEE